jgi:hypothetical protein
MSATTKAVHINATTGKVVNANFWTAHAQEIANAADAGVAAVMSVNGVEPDGPGNVELVPSDIGAAPAAATTSALNALTTSVSGKAASLRTISGVKSLSGGGDLTADRELQLANDLTSPGNNKVYGTNGTGVKGWKDDPTGGGNSDPAPAIHAASSKAAPANTDEIGVTDSAASFGLKKLSWENLKSAIRAYTDTLYSTFSGAYSDLSGKPTLGTASALNVATSGNASSAQVVKGDDSRLSDARTPASHTHSIEQVTGLTAALDSKTSVTVVNGFGRFTVNGINYDFPISIAP